MDRNAMHLTDFPGREAEEKVMLVLHRHWFIFLKNIIILVLVAGAPLVVAWIWSHIRTWELAPNSLGYALVVSGGALFYLFLWILMYGYWLDYYLDFFIVTNKRVVDIEQSGLFGRTVAEERLYRIQDVTSDTQGIMATMLRYGNVYVQTAGKKERFIFEHVANPEDVARTILHLTDKIDDRMERPGDPSQFIAAAGQQQSSAPLSADQMHKN
ncbi:MAG: PH domain-containing protein [Candidatus Kerfeldbacteria bacterium]|nr:PH domain-containing protein [Candidatus Kerfeldbacteria bacterium]